MVKILYNWVTHMLWPREIETYSTESDVLTDVCI